MLSPSDASILGGGGALWLPVWGTVCGLQRELDSHSFYISNRPSKIPQINSIRINLNSFPLGGSNVPGDIFIDS